MRVNIVKKSNNTVFFLSYLGKGCAQWEGGELMVPEQHDVEMDFERVYTWGEDVFLSNKIKETMSFYDGKNKIVSRIIDIDKDVVTIKLCGDIIFLEIIGLDFSNVGKSIEFESSPNETKITPFYL